MVIGRELQRQDGGADVVGHLHPPLGAVPEPQPLGFEDLARRDDRLAAGLGEAREERPLEVRDVDAIDDMKENIAACGAPFIEAGARPALSRRRPRLFASDGLPYAGSGEVPRQF